MTHVHTALLSDLVVCSGCGRSREDVPTHTNIHGKGSAGGGSNTEHPVLAPTQSCQRCSAVCKSDKLLPVDHSVLPSC
jgi:hypothetical protein